MIKKLFRYYDYSLLVVMLLLVGFGLIMVYSAGSVWADLVLKKPSDYFFVRQFVWCLIAVPVGIFGMLFPYQAYRSFVKPLIIVSLVLLVLLYFAGKTVNSAQSWFSVGTVSFEPAEIVKITLIFYLASVYSNKQKSISDFKTSVLPPLIIVMVFFILVALQPDLGTALILIFISAVMVLCSGLKIRHLFFLAVSTGGFISLMFVKFLFNYQTQRFQAAYDPFSVASTTGRQLINSYVAIAAGGLTGRGLGNSIEKTGFLPEPQTDFIIAIIGEELGLLGILFVILCIAYLVFKGFVTAIRCKDVFGSLLAIGISSMLAIQTFINLGAATGLIPITGVTLPFISYGGSSLLIMIFSICVLINISAFVNMRRSSVTTEREKENVTTLY
ncbi:MULTISPECIES: FtsW/RodA/SpoVE family cell cycle protein [unclassified Sporolactobacillus]|uniref:FtsW/RodA/SpoVE family cell cycle protein n=1 Tax=unclassified Sporolactobacillus TaxID=2628533 RepID=UPI0023684DFE|nr:FtsW/RodA/SpoVE family cell cycle protein [Sporolactobacillus sp. CQH2019]MDD9147185.1 FtsW/RodA/SpoVE family cell cycle protein [Sporolactobacillus sp. CQH2019]